jgi:hypothetical protein
MLIEAKEFRTFHVTYEKDDGTQIGSNTAEMAVLKAADAEVEGVEWYSHSCEKVQIADDTFMWEVVIKRFHSMEV